MNVKVGQRFRLAQHLGYKQDADPNDEFTAFKNDHHPLFAGQVGEVVATGVRYGDQTEDHAVLEFEHHDLVNHAADKAEPEHNSTGIRRMHSATDAQLADATLYEPAGDAENPRDLGPPKAAAPAEMPALRAFSVIGEDA